MGLPILLLVGPAGSGKDTIADYLVKSVGATKLALADPIKRLAKELFHLKDEQLWGPDKENEIKYTYDLERLLHDVDTIHLDGHSLSDHQRLLLKKAVRKIVDYRPFTPRKVIQTLGTDWGRRVDFDFWTNKALHVIKCLMFDLTKSYAPEKGLYHEPRKSIPPLFIISDGRLIMEIVKIKEHGGQVWKIISNNVKKVGLTNHVTETEMEMIPDTYFDYFMYNHNGRFEYLTKEIDEQFKIMLGPH